MSKVQFSTLNPGDNLYKKRNNILRKYNTFLQKDWLMHELKVTLVFLLIFESASSFMRT